MTNHITYLLFNVFPVIPYFIIINSLLLHSHLFQSNHTLLILLLMPTYHMDILESNENQIEEREDVHNDSTSNASTKTTSMNRIDQGRLLYYVL